MNTGDGNNVGTTVPMSEMIHTLHLQAHKFDLVADNS